MDEKKFNDVVNFLVQQHLGGICAQLAMIRSQMTEALRMGEVLTKDGDRAFVRGIAYTILGIEQQLQMMLVPTQLPREEEQPKTEADN